MKILQIVILLPIKRAEAESDGDSDLRWQKRRTCTPYASPFIGSPLLNKHCQKSLDESDQTSYDESYEQLPKRQKQKKETKNES